MCCATSHHAVSRFSFKQQIPDTASRSRDALSRPRCELRLNALQREGVRNAGCSTHPQPRVQKVKSTRVVSPRTRRNHPAFRTQWVTACFVLSPVIDRLVLSPSLRLRMFPCPVGRGSPGQLLPTYGLQDHTTWAVRATSSSALHRQLTDPSKGNPPCCLIRA